MPLDIQRLRRSKAWLKAKRNPALAFYMINLWTAAWHDVPAGSLEDDDDVLADLAMCDPIKWPKVKADVLHGWVKCSDGRLYNPTTCEKARESWASKAERLEKDANERERKRREREERSTMFAALREVNIVPAWNVTTRELRALHSSHVTTGHTPVRVTGPDSHGDTPEESRLRQGQGQGQGQGKGDLNPVEPPSEIESPTRAVDLSIAMRQFGIQSNPSDPRLLTLAEQGVTVETMRAAAEAAKKAKPDEAIAVGYVVSILQRWSKEAENLNAGGARPPPQRGNARDESRMAAAASIGLGGKNYDESGYIDGDIREIS